MCGICGFTGTLQDTGQVINAMSARMAHRGPEDQGAYLGEGVTFGFRRLGFLDLDHGSQPMFNEDKSIVIVFNGEIYNYRELREELLSKGHSFANNSDTEVLIHLYEEEGHDMLRRLRGMFAFAVYDIARGTIFAARDHFGIKPFYYARLNGELVFASEIKCFLEHPDFVKEVNHTALENYLTFQYSVLDETFFRGVYKLPPAHCLTYSGGKLEISRYFDPTFSPQADMTLEQAVEQIEQAVAESIAKHKYADVEVGSFLSSGVDSSYVAACFGGENTFSVGFDYHKYNETDLARTLSEQIGVKNYSKLISPDEFWDTFPTVQYFMDEPLADPSAVALYFVSKLASAHVKGVMSGEGADELFGGYNIYQEPLSLAKFKKLPLPLRKALAALARAIPFGFKGKNFLIRASKPVEERFFGNAGIFSKAEREKILRSPSGDYPPELLTKPAYDKVSHYDDITKMQYIDINFWMVGDILLKADKMSMANSIELRVPLLDIEVFKVSSRIPTQLRVNRHATKHAFRLAAKKHLPEDWAKRRKLGFPVPIRIWLREGKYYGKVRAVFSGESAANFFVTGELLRLLDAHKSGKADNSRKIWTVYTFLIWHEQYFSERTPQHEAD
ncbi:MAG: asparagine synthase (glutamine-hydrolyzing) [Defluviitaleaceae bacterium]|nr:asparagine synthase (glutamine-hydrolyzing) [Defluviitaleaceae bacterium]